MDVGFEYRHYRRQDCSIAPVPKEVRTTAGEAPSASKAQHRG